MIWFDEFHESLCIYYKVILITYIWTKDSNFLFKYKFKKLLYFTIFLLCFYVIYNFNYFINPLVTQNY